MKLTKTKLKQLIKETLLEGEFDEEEFLATVPPGEELSVEDDEEENYEKLVDALHDILRHFLDEAGMGNDEVQRAVEDALETELGSDMGKILARGGQF